MELTPELRNYIRNERDRIAREKIGNSAEGRRRRIPAAVPRCPATLGPFSANPGGTCNRPCKPGDDRCGLHKSENFR